MIRRIAIVNTLLLLVSLFMMNAYAGSNVVASARVLPFTEYEITNNTNEITVSAVDVDKGYIDIANAITLTLRSNSPKGCLVRFYLSGRLFDKVEITGDNLRIESDEEINLPSANKEDVTYKFDIRLFLSKDIKPGKYQWPVGLMVSAL